MDADFSQYKAIIAPVLYMMKDGLKETLESYVKNGGVIVTGFMSGIVNQSDNVFLGGYPGPLRNMAGIWVEEIDALAPEQSNKLLFSDGTEYTCNLLCDIIHLENAVSIAEYNSDFYASSPAITKNDFGMGTVFYIGTQLEKRALEKTLDQVMSIAEVKPLIDAETKLEIVCRTAMNNSYYFIMNLTGDTQALPHLFEGKVDILTGNTLTQGTLFAPYDVALINMQ